MNDGSIAVHMRRRDVRAMIDDVILGPRPRFAAGKALVRAPQRNGAGDDGAEKRQEDDELIHIVR
jgi:hypothetical protein